MENLAFIENEETFGKGSTLVAESDYNSMENDRESDISNDMVVQEKDSGTDMAYSGEDIPPSTKDVRGRKKPTYVSPYRQQKIIPRASSNNSTNKKTQSALIRQSTFTKDEPTNEDVPIVDMLHAIKLSTTSAKNEKKIVVKRTQQNVSSIPKVCGPQRSNSTTTIRVSPSIKLNRSNTPLTQPPSRSNSTLTKINGNNINQIGSKISGIWKNKSNVSTTIPNNKISRNKALSNNKQIILSTCNPHTESS